MNQLSPAVFYFDYVDPASCVMDAQLRLILPPDANLKRHPFELRPPPERLIDPTSAEWGARVRGAAESAAEVGLDLVAPDFVPWSRKAHELRLHAEEKGCEDIIHRALFEARFEAGRDLGRVDVLVDLAVHLGLDLTETKAVLDVDRHTERVLELRRQALAEGVRLPATLRVGARNLEGPCPIDDLRGLLEAILLA